jgi:hypothetical protein
MNKFSVIPLVFVILASNFPVVARQTNEVTCEGGATGARAETKNYYVNICGHGKLVFVLTKKAGRTIIIPSNKKDVLSAKEGNFEYILKFYISKEQERCDCGGGEVTHLIIKESGKVIVKERVIHDRGGYLFLP